MNPLVSSFSIPISPIPRIVPFIQTDLLRQSVTDMNGILDKWCNQHSTEFHGGKMRGDRGEDIEGFVRNLIHNVADKTGKSLVAKRGDDDKKRLQIKGTDLFKMHQVDVHVYSNDQFVAVIECKAYLDSCFYARACDDFDYFRKFDYDVKKYIFTLEDGMDHKTRTFTDYVKEQVCDDIFYMMDGKRSSAKPVYDAKYRKPLNQDNMMRFIAMLCEL